MNLPELKNAEKYIGLYVVDFGDSSSTGFTADEVAEIMDSEKFTDAKVYKIYNAHPDGRLEIKGVPGDTFQLEMGMFFYAPDQTTAKANYDRLISIAVSDAPPSRAKVHHAKYSDGSFVTALIYPAEYNDEFSKWLLDADYKTTGQVIGGISAVNEYYRQTPEVIERHQLLDNSKIISKTGEQLLTSLKLAVQR